MPSSETITIDLRKATEAPLDLQHTLGDSFFAALDQDEILGGEVRIGIKVKAAAADSFAISIKAEGQVVVPCDRCLEDVTIPISTEARMALRYGEEDEEGNGSADVTVIPFTATTYDLGWDIYEFIALALPLQRVHPDGECNEEITQYIIQQ